MTASKNEPLSVISRLDALIEQALHLAKAPPFTDISIKMRSLSVNRLLKKYRLRTKWPFVRKISAVSNPVLRTNGPKSRLCP